MGTGPGTSIPAPAPWPSRSPSCGRAPTSRTGCCSAAGGPSSAGYQDQVVESAERHGADFTVTAKQYPSVVDRIHALATDPATTWTAALGRETEAGSEVAETTTRLLGRELRLIVRRQPRAAREQLAIDDLDGWRLHAIITNIDTARMGAAEVEAHHRLRGGVPRTPSGR